MTAPDVSRTDVLIVGAGPGEEDAGDHLQLQLLL